MRKLFIVISLAAGLTTATSWVAGQQESKTASAPAAEPKNNSNAQTSPAHALIHLSAEDRIEGEKRFRANCSRCHQTPHKFSPRATATIVRHMRVRATITDEDARLILKYLSQ
jgi:mono/diheme cytochrome c family protein